MKSKTSLFNKAIAKRNLTGHIGLWAGLLFVWILALPFSIYVRMKQILRYTDLGELTANEVLSVKVDAMVDGVWENMGVFVFLFAAIALVSAMFSFAYLFTSRNSNMVHTFPVDRMGLFCTNYLTGLLYQMIPMVMALAIGLLISASFGALSGVVLQQYLLWLGVAAIETIFFFSLSVCVLMFSGNMISVPVFYGILNFFYAGCMMTAEAMIDSVCYGVSANLMEIASNSILTPMIYMYRHIRVGKDNHGAYAMYGTKELAVYFAAAVVFVIIAVVAYQKKHIETAGDIITVGWLKPIFRWGTAVCFSAVGAIFYTQLTFQTSFMSVLVSGALIGTCVFFIAQMLIECTVRVFTKKRVYEGLIYMVCICAAYIALDADVFGVEKKVPATDEIEAVRMNGRLTTYAMSADEIAWAQDIHKQIIASKKQFENAAGQDTRYFSLYYELKDGSSLERDYQVPFSKEPDSIYAQIETYAKNPKTILMNYFGIHYPDIEVTGAYVQDYAEDGGMEVRVSEEDAKKLYRALVKDIEEGNFDAGEVEEDIVTAEVLENIYLVFEVLDKQGFCTPEDLFFDRLMMGNDGPARTEEVWLRPMYKHLIKELQKQGYLDEK